MLNSFSRIDREWKNELKVKDWAGRTTIIGVDLDGELGILDHDDYSIIIDKAEVPKLIEWLQKNFEGKE